MGLNGGGYTFVDPKDLPTLSNDELQALFTDKTSILLRAKGPQFTESGQTPSVLEPLPDSK